MSVEELEGALLAHDPNSNGTSGYTQIAEGKFWWSFQSENACITKGQFYLLPPDLDYTSRGPVELRIKAFHDVLLEDSLGAPHELTEIRLSRLEKLFRNKGELDFAESTQKLSWSFPWGVAMSYYDIRDYEPKIFVSWSRD